MAGLAHFVYIVRCADGSLYTGYARNLDGRVAAHNRGTGAKYTCSRRPVRLVYAEELPTLSAALKREYELKQWPRVKKQGLIRTRGGKARGVLPCHTRARQ
jgi:putative endonuclease